MPKTTRLLWGLLTSGMMMTAGWGGMEGKAAEAAVEPVQRQDPMIQKIVSGISEERITRILRKLEGFETRNTMSDPSQKNRGIGAAREWILEEFKSYSPRLEVKFDTHSIAKGGRVWKDIELRNVVAILPGTMRAATNRWILVSGHYDSLNLKVPAELRDHPEKAAELPAPGVSDDGSGTACVLECARVLSQFEFDATLVFVAFAGEEQGLVGARAMAGRLARERQEIEAVLNNDIIGTEVSGNGASDNRRVLLFSEDPNDSSSRQIARFVRSIAARYCPEMGVEMVFRHDRFGRGGDHTAFNREGYAAVRFTSANENFANQHSPGDTLANASAAYTAKVTRINAAAAAALALGPKAPVVARRSAVNAAVPANGPGLSRGSGYDAVLRWDQPDPEPDLAGFLVKVRTTTQPDWEREIWAGNVREFTLKNTPIDQLVFGVAAVDRGGHESPTAAYVTRPIEASTNGIPAIRTHATRAAKVGRRYLNLPVKNGAPKRWINLSVDGRKVRDFEMELADATPDWWAFADLSEYYGKTLVIEVDQLPGDSRALETMEFSDAIKGAENLYGEGLRPQFHFTSRRGWNNDPNGLVFTEGEYHMFYQHNPYGWNWGNMHWGHAVSADLVHWRELGEALYPDAMGTMFSGSAVVDSKNTAGFGKEGERPIVCVYTAAGGTSRESKGAPFTQGLAFSTDRGRTWTKYSGNPVVPHLAGENRDPKVFWYQPERKWVMAIYLEKSDYGIFESRDLKQWQRLSGVTIPGTSECPEFFEIPVEGGREPARWVFYGGNGRYLVGKFDGRNFVSESGPHSLQYGNCFYASQTFNNIPEEDGRRILVPWGTVAIPGMPFNQMMGFPVELTLRRTADGLRLQVNPIRELAALRREKRSWSKLSLDGNHNPLDGLRGELWEIELEVEPGRAGEVGIEVRGTAVSYDPIGAILKCGDKQAPCAMVDGKVHLHLLVDRVSIEIFANKGAVYMPMGFHPAPENRGLRLFARGGGARVESAVVYELGSIWGR